MLWGERWRLHRHFAFAKQFIFRRELPHGIISWQYILVYPPVAVRTHRRLWFLAKPPAMPFAVFFFIEFFLWLRWVLFSGWHRSIAMVRLRGSEIAKREGITPFKLMKRVLWLSLFNCIPPSEIHAFRLYADSRGQIMWNYVYTHELPAFHHWRNTRTGHEDRSNSLLQDKFRLSETLEVKGVPMLPVLAFLPRGGSFDLLSLFKTYQGRLFCKPCHGSCSRDSFVMEKKGGAIHIFSVKNGMISDISTIERLKEALTCDDVLVQQFITNHPVFKDLCSSDDAVTLRLITEIHPQNGLRCYCATLEIPNDSGRSRFFHTMLPVDLNSGEVLPFPTETLLDQCSKRHDAMYNRLEQVTVPFWDEIIGSALTAHQSLPGIYAIAWDYVITPTGPFLLEGNAGWGTKIPQILHGGLLKDIMGYQEV